MHINCQFSPAVPNNYRHFFAFFFCFDCFKRMISLESKGRKVADFGHFPKVIMKQNDQYGRFFLKVRTVQWRSGGKFGQNPKTRNDGK